MTDTINQLLVAVLTDPGDEAPRAALADFLQENPHLIAAALRSLARHTSNGDLCGTVANTQNVALGLAPDYLDQLAGQRPPDYASWDEWPALDDDSVDCPVCGGVGLAAGLLCRECNGYGSVG